MIIMIRLPVSIGEAIDKLTILDIKCRRIQDEGRRAYCKQEYDILYGELKDYVEKYNFYYNQLYTVNDEIWRMQDDIRVTPDPLKCVEILDKNDMRFRIKDVINNLTNSYLREKKGYSSRRALFIGHLGLGDHIGLIGAVRYIALQHDETVVVCSNHNVKNVSAFFADNPSIKIMPVSISYLPGYYPESPEKPGKVVLYDPKEWTNVYESGFYKKNYHMMNDLPSCFYRDMGLDPNIRHTHFHIPSSEDSLALYRNIEDKEYIFVQQKSSDCITDLITWDKNKILTIDPNINLYDRLHEWYGLAQMFVNKPFTDYVDTIVHAKEIHTVDSSFYCLASYLPLKAEVKKCYERNTGVFISTYTFN